MRLLFRGSSVDKGVAILVALGFVGHSGVPTTLVAAARAEPSPTTKDTPPAVVDVTKDDLEDLYNIFDCREERPLQIPSDEHWKMMQSIYQEIVGPESSSLPPGGYLGINGFYVPVEVRMGDHGRGIYSLEDINKGTLVWRSFLTARFDSGAMYQRFLHALPSPWACDALFWTYARLELNETGEDLDNEEAEGYDIRLVVCMDLDPGSLINGCDVPYDCNLKLIRDVSTRTSGCRLDFYAARTIRRGEELQIDYSFGEQAPRWTEIALQSGVTPTLTLLKQQEQQQEQQRGDDVNTKATSHEEL
jgi:hypothetical protein